MELSNGLDSQDSLRRFQARDVLTSVLPRSRGTSPARTHSKAGVHANNDAMHLSSAKMLVRPGKISTSQGSKLYHNSLSKTDNVRRESPSIGEEDEIMIPGVEEFNKVCDSIHTTGTKSTFVAAFSKTLEKHSDHDEQAESSIRESGRDDSVRSNVDSHRSEATLVSLFAKTDLASHPRMGTDPELATENTTDSSRTMGRRRGNRGPAGRTRRQVAVDDQSAEEQSHSTVVKHYIPSYVQPVTENIFRNSQNHIAGSNSTSGFSDANRRPGGKGFVKRQHARRGDNRLSSSSSGDSSDNEPSAVTRQTPPRVVRRRMRAHRSAVANSTVSRESRTGIQLGQSATSASISRSPGCQAKAPFLVEDSKYATLPANFSPSFEKVSASKSSVETSDRRQTFSSHKHNKTSDINQNVLSTGHELIISKAQTSSLDDNSKEKRSQLSNTGQPRVEHTLSSALQIDRGELYTRTDRHSSVQNRRASLEKTTVHLAHSKPSFGAIRSVFDHPDLPKREFGQVYNAGKTQVRSNSATSSRKSSVSVPEPANEAQEVVFQQAMTKAVKVGVDCWPRDDDTRKLLNLGNTNAPSVSNNVLLGAADVFKRTDSTNMKVGSQATRWNVRAHGGNTVGSLPILPKETNLSDLGYEDEAVVQNQALKVKATETKDEKQSQKVTDGYGLDKENASVDSQSETFPRSHSAEDFRETSSRLQKAEHLVSPNWSFKDSDAKLNAFTEASLELNNDIIRNIEASLHDISLHGTPLYTAPTFDNQEAERQASKDDESVNKSSTQIAPRLSTSSRKSSVVSQSTALPRKTSMSISGIMPENTEIDEGCFVEDDTISKANALPIDLHHPEVTCSSSIMEGSNDSIQGWTTHSAEMQHPPVEGSISIEPTRTNDGFVMVNDSQQEPVSKAVMGVAEPNMENSASDLSCFSESAMLQDDFDDATLATDARYDFPGKVGYKNGKKKSLSDPITDAIVTAGKKRNSAEHENIPLCTSSSEPNISEQMDVVGELNAFAKLGPKLGRAEPTVHAASALSASSLFENTSAMEHELETPRMGDLGQLSTAEFQGGPAPSDSSNRSSLAEKSDIMEHLEKEEQKFQQVLDSMTSDTSSRKPSVTHTRSCSEPCDTTHRSENDVLQSSVKRIRRPGTTQAPSLDDVVLDTLPKSKPYFGTEARIHAATLPRTAISRTVDYAELTSKDSAKLNKRSYVVQSLLDTEKSYVVSLRMLAENYLAPLRLEHSNLCDPRLVNEIFYQVPEIMKHHIKFSQLLSQCCKEWDLATSEIGNVFVELFNKDNFVDLYTGYINNFPNAREAVETAIQAKSAFKSFLEQCQRENKDKQGLFDLLIQPVQRIPRYELFIKDLLKNTPDDHPDKEHLLIAQKEIHALSVRMNQGEKAVEEVDFNIRRLQEIEQIVVGCVDIGSSTKRQFLRQDVCMELRPGGKKDRSLWLFNDCLMCTSVKKGKGTTMRRSSMNLWSISSDNMMIDFTHRYKFLWKFPLEDVDLGEGGNETKQSIEKQIQQLNNDNQLLAEIRKLAACLNTPHASLDDVVNELLNHTRNRLTEKQQSHSHGTGMGHRVLEIEISTSDGVKLFQFEFVDNHKERFENRFREAKKNNSKMRVPSPRSDMSPQKGRRNPPFVKSIPVGKTRNGMQFSCAVANTDNATGNKEVWVCNTDEYAGEICFLSLEPEIATKQCIRVCKSKICCVAQVPAWDRRFVPTSKLLNDFSTGPVGHVPDRHESSSSANQARAIIPWDDSDPSDEGNTSPMSTYSSNSNPYSTNNSVSNYDEDMLPPLISPLLPSTFLHRKFCFTRSVSYNGLPSADNLTSTDSTVMSEHGSVARAPSQPLMSGLVGSGAFKKDNDGTTVHGSLEDLLCDPALANCKNASETLGGNGSIWMGTEDGKIFVYSTQDSSKDLVKKNILLHQSASVQCILYHDRQVFVALANGDLVIYSRSQTTGYWDFENKKTQPLGSSPHPISKMIVIREKELWCGCQNQVIILDLKTCIITSRFSVSQDPKRQIYCMVCSDMGVWIALDKRAHIKLYHTNSSHDHLTDIDVSHAVSKMLASSDAIIRQHKAACLRITSLLVCKDLLWVGTSAGVVLTVALPNILPNTTSLTLPPIPQGLPYGHTGHVRFLTTVDIAEKESTPRNNRRPSLPKRRSSSASAQSQAGTMCTLVISGGDGYEDFHVNSASEAAGRVDSTNHMLAWKV